MDDKFIQLVKLNKPKRGVGWMDVFLIGVIVIGFSNLAMALWVGFKFGPDLGTAIALGSLLIFRAGKIFMR